MVDFEAIMRLVPERRIEELQQIIEELEGGIEQRERDLAEARRLLAMTLEEQQALNEVREEPRTISLEDEDIKNDADVQTLDATVREETPQRNEKLEKLLQTRPRTSDELFYQRESRPISELYQELRSIYEREGASGQQLDDERERLYQISRDIAAKRGDIESGEYKPGEKAAHLLTTAERLLKGMYKGTVHENDPQQHYQ